MRYNQWMYRTIDGCYDRYGWLLSDQYTYDWSLLINIRSMMQSVYNQSLLSIWSLYNWSMYYCYINRMNQMGYRLIINHMLDDVHSIIDQCTIDNQSYNIHIDSSDLIIILIILSTACALAINTIAYLMICNQLSDLQLTDSYHILHVNRCLQWYSTT